MIWYILADLAFLALIGWLTARAYKQILSLWVKP